MSLNEDAGSLVDGKGLLQRSNSAIQVSISGTQFSLDQRIFLQLKKLPWNKSNAGVYSLQTSPELFEIVLNYLLFNSLPDLKSLPPHDREEIEVMAVLLELTELASHVMTKSGFRPRLRTGSSSSLKADKSVSVREKKQDKYPEMASIKQASSKDTEPLSDDSSSGSANSPNNNNDGGEEGKFFDSVPSRKEDDKEAAKGSLSAMSLIRSLSRSGNNNKSSSDVPTESAKEDDKEPARGSLRAISLIRSLSRNNNNNKSSSDVPGDNAESAQIERHPKIEEEGEDEDEDLEPALQEADLPKGAGKQSLTHSFKKVFSRAGSKSASDESSKNLSGADQQQKAPQEVAGEEPEASSKPSSTQESNAENRNPGINGLRQSIQRALSQGKKSEKSNPEEVTGEEPKASSKPSSTQDSNAENRNPGINGLRQSFHRALSQGKKSEKSNGGQYGRKGSMSHDQMCACYSDIVA